MENQFNTSLWGDEAFSAILSMKSIPQILEIITRDTSPPLYNITEHLAFRLFGSSEAVIRGLSFFYYLIAVFFVYKIASYIWGKKAGYLAAAFTFFNPFFFIYAFEGRMYSILAAGVTASMYFFLTQNWLGYIIATTAALYSHHFSIFALFIQGIIFLKYLIKKKERKNIKPMFLSFLVIGFLYIPWLMPLYKQTQMVASGFWLGTPTLADLRELIYKYLAQGIANPLNQYALYLVFGLLLLRDWTKKLWQSGQVILWFLGPIIIVWLISQKFQSVFYDRYLLYAIPAGMIIITTNLRKVSFVLLALLLPLFILIDWNYFTHPVKRPFKQLASYIIENKKGDDFLINWNSASHHIWESKYYGLDAPIYILGDRELPFFVGTALMQKQDIIRQIPAKSPEGYTYQRVMAITSGPVDEVIIPLYTKGEYQQFGDLKAVWFEK